MPEPARILLQSSFVVLSCALAAASAGAAEPASAEPEAAAGEASPGAETTAAPASASAAPPLEVGASVHARYVVSHQTPTNYFELARARLSLDLHPSDAFRAQLDVAVAETPILRDAFVQVGPADWLRFSAGQFKKPFSRLALESLADLPLVGRGIVVDAISDDLGYGGRDLGLMASGGAGWLRYAAGVFNGTRGAGEVDSGKDAAARLELRPSKRLHVGASGSLRHQNPQVLGLPARTSGALGLDSRVRLWRLEVVGEVLWAEDSRFTAPTQLGGAMGYAELRLPWRTELVELRPIVTAQALDPALGRRSDRAFSFGGGFNTHVGDALRIMVQLEQVHAEPRSSVPAGREVVVQLALDEELGLSLVAAGDDS